MEAAALTAIPLLVDTAYYVSCEARTSNDIIRLGSDWPIPPTTQAYAWTRHSLIIGTGSRAFTRAARAVDGRSRHPFKTCTVAALFLALALALGGFGVATMATFAMLLRRGGKPFLYTA